jgi:type I restriction enzyme S subunit
MTDGLKDKHREAMIDILSSNERVEQVVLFGSRGMGTFTATSDVDIVLYGAELTPTDRSKLAAAIDELSMPQQVDLLLYKSIKKRELLNHIEKHGVEWWRRSWAMAISWPEVVFGDVLLNGTRNGVYKKKEFHGSGVKIVNMGELFANPRLYSIPMKRVELTSKEKDKSCLQPGDLLFARRSLVAEGTGKCSIVMEVDEPTTFESSIIRARPDSNKLHSLFAYYLFNSPHGKYLLGTILRHVAVAGITGSDLVQLNLPLPPMPDQRAIAHILGSLDDKIELNRRMNQTLEAAARAIFKSWFVDFDPVRVRRGEPLCSPNPGLPDDVAALFPDSFEDSELGEIPKGWKPSTIGSEFNLTMGQSPPGKTYNETGNGLPFFQGRRDFGFRYPSNRVYCTATQRLADHGDTLVSVRAPVGDINMAMARCCVGRGVAGIRHKSGSRSYTYYAMHTLSDRFARFEAEGTVFGAINKKQFEGLRWLSPDENLVAEFEKIAFAFDEQIEKNTNESATLNTLRDTLLPKLISGDLRVPDAEKFVEPACAGTADREAGL